MQAIMTCNGTANHGCWFPNGMIGFNFRTQPTPSPAYTTISVSTLEPASLAALANRDTPSCHHRVPGS